MGDSSLQGRFYRDAGVASWPVYKPIEATMRQALSVSAIGR